MMTSGTGAWSGIPGVADILSPMNSKRYLAQWGSRHCPLFFQQTFSLQCCAAEGDFLACKRFYTVSQHMEVDDFTSRLTTDEYIALVPLWHPISLFLYIYFPQIL